MSAANQLVLASFRPMSDSDLDTVVRIERECYEFPWKKKIFHDCLRVGYSCWVVEYTAQIVGYGLLSTGAGEAHILNLCIASGFRRIGLASMLLNHMQKVAKYHHTKTMFLEVRPTNQSAIRLYEYEGFAEVGERKNYYPAHNGREDAIIMAKELVIK